MKNNEIEVFVVSLRHESDSDPKIYLYEDITEALEKTHQFFLSYGFEIVKGRPWDSGNQSLAGQSKEELVDDDGGFEVFQNLKMIEGKVFEFMHCYGEGPVCEVDIKKLKLKN